MDIRATNENDLDLDIELTQYKGRFLQRSVSLTFYEGKEPYFIGSFFLDDNTIGFTKLKELSDRQKLSLIYAFKKILKEVLGTKRLFAFIKKDDTETLRFARYFKFFKVDETEDYFQLTRNPQ